MNREKNQQFPGITDSTLPPVNRRTGKTDRRSESSDRRTAIRYGRRYRRKEDRRINFVKDRRNVDP